LQQLTKGTLAAEDGRDALSVLLHPVLRLWEWVCLCRVFLRLLVACGSSDPVWFDVFACARWSVDDLHA
jgi:hypothetical protein